MVEPTKAPAESAHHSREDRGRESDLSVSSAAKQNILILHIGIEPMTFRLLGERSGPTELVEPDDGVAFLCYRFFEDVARLSTVFVIFESCSRNQHLPQ